MAKTIIEKRGTKERSGDGNGQKKRKRKGEGSSSKGEGLRTNHVGVFWGCGCNSSKKSHNGLIPN